MTAAQPDPTRRLLELAAYLKRSQDTGTGFDLDTVTAELPGYDDDAPRDADGRLSKGAKQSALRKKFQRDLHDLNSMLGVDVRYDEHDRVYRVARPFFSPAERLALVAASTLAAVDDDRPLGPAALGGAVEEEGQEVFLRVDAAAGLLRRAIEARHEVAFRYNGRDRVLEPYSLAYRDDHWYVAGRDQTVGTTRTFRLDRIEAQGGHDVIEERVDSRFELPDDLDAAGLFRFDPDEWGTDPPVRARVRVRADVAARFQLIVGGDIVEERDDVAVVEADVRNYDAFRDRVLSFRDYAQVLAPAELVAVVDDWLAAIVAVGA